VVHSWEDSRENTTSEVSGGSPQDWKRYFPSIVTLLSSVAGLGTVVYILGIFSLWVPIQRTYSGDFVTAWHATSLVPKTVVVGLGAQHLVAVPLIFVAIMVLIAVTVEYLCLTPSSHTAVDRSGAASTSNPLTSKNSEGKTGETSRRT